MDFIIIECSKNRAETPAKFIPDKPPGMAIAIPGSRVHFLGTDAIGISDPA